MPEVTEGQLTFHFPTEWQAISYDAPNGFYKTVVQCAPLDFKAVDILARSPLDTFTWIEIKDCVGNETENRPRFSEQDSTELVASKAWIKQQGWETQVIAKRAKPYLPDEVANKVVDTFSRLSQAIRSRLHFLNIHQVTVCNEQTIPPNVGWSVTRKAA